MKLVRYIEVLKYGWKHASVVADRPDCKLSRIQVFIDIFKCYNKYRLWSNNYLKEEFWKLDSSVRKIVGEKYRKRNTLMDNWYDWFYDNNRFISKYSDVSMENSLRKRKNRQFAYIKRYKLSSDCEVGPGVQFASQHYTIGELKVGKHVIFSRDINVDYTGGLVIGNNVGISEGVKILTHNHDYLNTIKDKSKLFWGNAYKTPLEIGDGVWIGARVLINSGVSSIGRKAVLSAGAVIRKKVPPYAIVMGNPAKIIGFSMRPDEAYEYECTHYPESDRISLSVLEKNYQKYFVNRLDEIKRFTSI